MRFCWIVDPESCIVWIYNKGGEPLKLSHPGVQITTGPVTLILSEIFG